MKAERHQKQCVQMPGADGKQFNFKVVLVESIGEEDVPYLYHLLLIYNHALADGVSGMIMTHQLLRNYEDKIALDAADSTIVPSWDDLSSEFKLLNL